MFQGVMVPLVTPLDASGHVCAASVERLIESVRPAVTGLVPTLSSGEGWRLTPSQWHDMVSCTRRFARGLPVLAGIALPTTAEAIERARLAKQLGVDAVVVPPPFRSDLPQADLLEHYRAIHRATGLPLFLYNEPKLTGTGITIATFVELCRQLGIVGIKDSSGSAHVTRALVAAGTGVPVFQGWEPLCAATTPGVQGYILPLANLDPALCRSMLKSPSATLQAAMDSHCADHDLLGDEWYLGLKGELYRRGTIANARGSSEPPLTAPPHHQNQPFGFDDRGREA
jgi:4-hydroxy-tetrahydrodipicolinate synthase